MVKQVTTADQALTKVEEEQKRIAEEQAAAEQAKQAEEQAKQAAAAKKRMLRRKKQQKLKRMATRHRIVTGFTLVRFMHQILPISLIVAIQRGHGHQV